jgi:transcription elongation factor Elf1
MSLNHQDFIMITEHLTALTVVQKWMVTTMPELKPCPFCGGKDVELRAGVMFNGAVHCNNCSADVVFDAVRMIAEGDYDWQSAVTDGWNRRVKDANL